MSIILTAGKHAVGQKPKKAKKKQNHGNDSSGNSAPPPISSDKTVVWYWLLDGVRTTVMYTKASSEVWCNGVTLATQIDFGDDSGSGAHVDFVIHTNANTHQATIKKVVIPGGCISHQLFVDQYMVLEHMGQPPAESTTLISRDMAEADLGQSPGPPAYSELYPSLDQKKTQ